MPNGEGQTQSNFKICKTRHAFLSSQRSRENGLRQGTWFSPWVNGEGQALKMARDVEKLGLGKSLLGLPLILDLCEAHAGLTPVSPEIEFLLFLLFKLHYRHREM